MTTPNNIPTALTCEAFMIADYERLRAENHKLQSEVLSLEHKLKNTEGQIMVDNTYVDAVRIRVRNDYYLFDYSDAAYHDYTIDQLRELIALDDETLFQTLCNTSIGWGDKVIVVDRSRFAGTIKFSSYNQDKTWYLDVDNATLYDACSGAVIENYVPKEDFEAAKGQALNWFKRLVEDRIAKLIRKAEEQAAQVVQAKEEATD